MNFYEALQNRDVNTLDIWKKEQQKNSCYEESETESVSFSDSSNDSELLHKQEDFRQYNQKLYCNDKYYILNNRTLEVIYDIVQCQDVYVLEWLYENINYIILCYAQEIQESSFENGSVKVLRWCKEKDLYYYKESVVLAGYAKETKVLDWWEKNKDWTKGKYEQKKAIDNAVFGHNLKVLDWWVKYEKKNNKKIKIDEDSMRLLCKKFSMQLLEWCYENRQSIDFNYDQQAINVLCKYGQKEKLRWWYKKQEELEMIYDENAIAEMCDNHELETLAWWITSGLELKYDRDDQRIVKYLNIIEQNIYIQSKQKDDVCQICLDNLYKKKVFKCNNCKKELHKQCHMQLKKRQIKECLNCKSKLFF